jgi:pimeloyl-ACP methyl ester carboxylesterase
MQLAADVPQTVQRLVLLAPPSTQGLPVYRKDDSGQPTDEVLTTREELAEDPVSVAPALRAIETEDARAMRQLWATAIYVHEQPADARFEAYVAESLKERCLLDVDYALVHFNISRADNGIEPGTGEVDRIAAPTLVVRGEDDAIVPEPLVRQAVADIESAEYVELSRCGHVPMVDDLDGLLARIEPFLAGEA